MQEKLLPNDIEAEEALLGAVLIDAECLHLVANVVTSDDFYREKNGLVWKAFLDLWREQMTPDQVTVARALSIRGHLADAGGMGFLSHLVAVTPTSAHVGHYASLVKETSRLRTIISQAEQLARGAYNERPSYEVAEAGVRGLLQLRTGAEDRMPMTTKALYDRYQAQLLEEMDAGPDFIPGITTGFNALNKMLGGWKPGLLYVVGARTSMGKTTFAGASVEKAVEAGLSVYLFTLETTQLEMLERIWYQRARVNMKSYRALPMGSPDRDAQRERLVDVLNDLGSHERMTIDDRRGLMPMEIRATLQAHSNAYGKPDLVVIDYLNLLRPGESRRTRYEQVGETIQALKDIGGEAGVPIVLLAQLSREPERRPDTDRRPTLADFRDAGTIEEAASAVLGLYRPAYYYKTQEEWAKVYPTQRYPKNLMEVHVLKQQSGPVGMLRLYCEIESGFMGDMGMAEAA